MRHIDDLAVKLEELLVSDKLETRQEIVAICNRLFNEETAKFVRLKKELQRVIEQLGVMEEFGKKKEPGILHMDIGEVGMLLEKLREVRGLGNSTPLNHHNI